MSQLPDNSAQSRDEQAAGWCLALAEAELPPPVRAAFDRWIADPDNERAFAEAAAAWQLIDLAAGTPDLVGMRRAALRDFALASGPWYRRVPAWAGAIAAVLLVAILSVAILYRPVQVYQTGIGERRIAMLDDGSKLSLDADTEVDVRLSRGRRDLTLLRGRAKFDVAHDPLRPFAVAAGDKIVVATGTSFSVEMLDRKVHVLLYEGHVAVLDGHDAQPVPRQNGGALRAIAADQGLSPGKELIAPFGAAATATVGPADEQRSASWESGQLSFDDEPLATAVERINRYSKDKIVIGDGAAAIRVNGVFKAGDTDAFVEGVAAIGSLKAARDAGKITLIKE
jgi:transmembrane sensor